MIPVRNQSKAQTTGENPPETTQPRPRPVDALRWQRRADEQSADQDVGIDDQAHAFIPPFAAWPGERR
jgi:hypothetical protein